MPNRRCLQINSVIFRSCSCYVFMQKLGFLFLVKGVKISAISSSFTKTTELKQPCHPGVPVAVLFTGDSLFYWCYFIKYFFFMAAICGNWPKQNSILTLHGKTA